MIVSHAKKLIFIANGKTGTTSIEAVLQGLQEEDRLAVPVPGLFLGKHIPASVLREFLGIEIWQSYFKFGFVRNPVDRFLSTWRHIVRDSELDYRELVRHPRSTFKHWRYARSLGVPEVPTRIEAEHVRHIVSLQSDLRNRCNLETNFQYPMFYAANGDKCVDFIGKYETLRTDCASIAQRIGLDLHELPVLNVGKGRRTQIKFSSAARAAIERVYAEDFERFGYEFPSEYCDSGPRQQEREVSVDQRPVLE